MIPLPIDSAPCWLLAACGTVRAGFPSPAEDYGVASINLTEKLVKHPQATFFLRVAGDSMDRAGVFDGDYIVVDRAVKPQAGFIVVAVLDGNFTLKYLRRRNGAWALEAANPTYPMIVPREGSCLEIWGVATTSLHPLPGTNFRNW